MIRSIGALLAVVLATGSGSAGAADVRPPGCEIESGTLTWGFKESFRAYIDGSIANGEWTVADGATYETPEFAFPALQGRIDPRVPSGGVDFAGSIRFTGHGGVLDTTVSDPTLVFASTGAELLLDVEGPTMQGDQVAVAQARFVDIDLSGQDLSPVDGVVTVRNAPTILREEGSAAFPDYEAGAEFDPVSFTIDIGDCDVDELPTGRDTSETAAPSWVAWTLIGAAAAVVAALVAGVLVLTRRR